MQPYLLVKTMRTNVYLFLFAVCLQSAWHTASAESCYESYIVSPSPFLGNNGEMVRLRDGSVWEVKFEYEYMYEYGPPVLVCPARGKLIVRNKALNVMQVSGARSAQPKKPETKPLIPPTTAKWELFEETNLVGSISGTVKAGSIFRTVSGSVYEVTGPTLQLVLELQPEVMVFRFGDVYKLVVEGFDEPLICQKLK